MKQKLTFFLCAIFLFSAQTWGQTWEVTPTMTAVLDSKGVLTISTTKEEGEDIPDARVEPLGDGQIGETIYYICA